MKEERSIINLATGEPVTLLKRDDKWCQSGCKNVLVDTHLRKLTCRECGADVELFSWIVRMAREESYLLQRIHDLKNEQAVHTKRLGELEDEEKRVKARIRTAKDSLLRSAGI